MILFINAVIKAKIKKYNYDDNIVIHDIFDIPETELKEGFSIYLLERFCKVKIVKYPQYPDEYITLSYYHQHYMNGDSDFSDVSIEVKYLNKVL